MTKRLFLSLALIYLAVVSTPVYATFSFARDFPKTGCAGCVDYDKDGYSDLTIGLSVYHNDGAGCFVKVTDIPATIDPYGNGIGSGPLAWADFDGDGIRDVLVFGNGTGSVQDSFGNCIGHPVDRIIKVNGFASGVPTLADHCDLMGWDVPYTNPTGVESLTTNENATSAVALADVNRDGKIDVYLGRGRLGDLGSATHSEWYGKDWLVENLSDLGFLRLVDISNDVGLTRENQYCPHESPQLQFRNTDGLATADYDYDGYTDFFAASYRCKCNALWKGGHGDKHRYMISNGGDQHNCQSSTGLNLSNLEQGDLLHGVGAYWLDYDNDGYLDLLEARVSHYTKAGALRLWHNDHNGSFTDVSNLLPQARDAWASQHYRCIAVGDFDNDGDLDIYVTRYALGPVSCRDDLPHNQRGRMLRNDLIETGSPGFTDVTAAENLDNGSHADTWGACFIDYNNDGKLDLFTIQGSASGDSKDELWRNDGAWTGHWLLIDLAPPREVQGIRINRDAIGAVVRIWIDKNRNGQMDNGEVMTRQQIGYTTGSSFWQGPTRLHFGLGSYTPGNAVIKGSVFWPGAIGVDGKPIWIDFSVPEVDRVITVSESLPPSGIPGIPTSAGLYVGSSVSFQWAAYEDIVSAVAGYNCQVGTSPGGHDVFDGNVGNELNKTITGQDGHTYYCRVQSIGAQGSCSGWSPSSDGVTVDTTAPTGSLLMESGAAYTNKREVALSLNGDDYCSGVSQMRFSQDDQPFGEWQPFRISTKLQLADGDGMKKVSVMYRDIAGNTSQPVSDDITLDRISPIPGNACSAASADDIPIIVTYSGASDELSGLKQVRLWYREGPTGAWKPASCQPQIGANGSFAFTDVSERETYYFALVAEDFAGNQSTPPSEANVIGVVYNGVPPCRIADAKALGATDVNISGIVGADFGVFFYLEAENRSAGIRVKKAVTSSPALGTVRVTGSVSLLPSGELEVEATRVSSLDHAAAIPPLSMSNRVVGGGQRGAQVGVSGGKGINSIGLLVRICGWVHRDSPTRLTIDDGSATSIEAQFDPGLESPCDGSYVVATGVSSCEKDEVGSVRRLLLVKSYDQLPGVPCRLSIPYNDVAAPKSFGTAIHVGLSGIE